MVNHFGGVAVTYPNGMTDEEAQHYLESSMTEHRNIDKMHITYCHLDNTKVNIEYTVTVKFSRKGVERWSAARNRRFAGVEI